MNSDGNDDIIISGYCGTTHIFYGKGKGVFAKGEFLKDESGNPVSAGRYSLGVKTKGFYTVAREKAASSNAVTAVDWDNDGDYDLVMSTNKEIRLCINKGNSKEPRFSCQTTILAIKSQHYAYDYTDWDGDGLWDIICGGKNGGVYVYINKGKLGEPIFNKAVCLLTSKDVEPKSFSMSSCQIRLTDYNNDGKMDILLGSRSSNINFKEGVSPEKEAELTESIYEAGRYYKKVRNIYDELYKKYPNYNEFYKVYRENKEVKECGKKMNICIAKYQPHTISKEESHVYVILGK